MRDVPLGGQSDYALGPLASKLDAPETLCACGIEAADVQGGRHDG